MTGAKVRGKVKAILSSSVWLDIDGKTLVIFQTLLEWRGKKAVEIGPYCGGGRPPRRLTRPFQAIAPGGMVPGSGFALR